MSETLNIPVTFDSVSIGETTARLGMKIDKSTLNIVAAEEVFCGRRLTGRIELGGGEDSQGQSTMFETELIVGGSFDIHRFGVSSDHYTTGATFRLKEIEISDLAQFSKGTGRLIAENVESIPTDVVEEDEFDGVSFPGTFTAEGEWTKYSLDDLFEGSILKSLKAAGLNSVGDLHEYQQPASNGHINQLADIKGLGPSKVTIVEDRMIEFWRDNNPDE